MAILLALVLSALVGFTHAQNKDPIKDFCRLWGHQTALVDRDIYIDGGLVNWQPVADNYTSTWLRHAELDVNNLGFPQEEADLPKNSTVPSLTGAVLWPDKANKILYLFGGEYSNSPPLQFTLWSYDIFYKSWNVTTAANNADVPLQRPSWGAGVAVEDIGKGFYYGGWLSNASVPSWGASRMALSNMIIYDMLQNRFQNSTGPDDIPRAEGVMLYIPMGDAGMLVYFGGVQAPGNNGTVRGVPMSTIFLFDIANNQWYDQTATGDVPEMRRRFCAGATWAQDQSSYNIYLYGGASAEQGVGFGDVYVLSLPSFTWIKYWPRAEDAAGAIAPHHSLTCNVIDNAQMIVMGGTFTNTSDCDLPTVQGMHGLDLGQANSQRAKWAEFNPNVTSYQVPTDIQKTIGGGPTGGATLLAPSGGWAHRDLSVEATRKYSQATRAPTRSFPSNATASATSSASPSKKSNKGVIGGAVGGTIGGLLVFGFIGSFLFFYLRGKKRRGVHHPEGQPVQTVAPKADFPGSPYSGYPSPPPPVELPTPKTDGPISPHSTFPSPSQPSHSPTFGTGKQGSSNYTSLGIEMPAEPVKPHGSPSASAGPTSANHQRSSSSTTQQGHLSASYESAPSYNDAIQPAQPYYPPPGSQQQKDQHNVG